MEVTVNKRKVTRNIIEEKSGRVMEVETEVTTDDSDEDVLNAGNVILFDYCTFGSKIFGPLHCTFRLKKFGPLYF